MVTKPYRCLHLIDNVVDSSKVRHIHHVQIVMHPVIGVQILAKRAFRTDLSHSIPERLPHLHRIVRKLDQRDSCFLHIRGRRNLPLPHRRMVSNPLL